MFCMIKDNKNVTPAAGFTLVEVMVVLSVMTLLAGITMPSLIAAKSKANCIVCLSNQRTSAAGLSAMAFDERGKFTPAYEFAAASDGRGYATWAGILAEEKYVESTSFTCPEFPNGGLPAANPSAGHFAQGQTAETPGTQDLAPESCAFTVNELICPRPRFEVGVDGATCPARRVGMDELDSNIILVTEFAADWKVLSPGDTTCRSYLPVHHLVGIGKMTDRYDLNAVQFQDKPCFADGGYRLFRTANLVVDPVGGLANPPRLNVIGRNHSRRNYAGFRRTTVTFVDGHSESLTISHTLGENLWGSQVYSVVGDQRIKSY